MLKWESHWENLCLNSKYYLILFFSFQDLLHSMSQKASFLLIISKLKPLNTKYQAFNHDLICRSFQELGNQQFRNMSFLVDSRSLTIRNLKLICWLPASLMLSFLSRRIFYGFMSRWIMAGFLEWRYLIAEIICLIITFV